MSHQERRKFLLAERAEILNRMDSEGNPFARVSLKPRLAKIEEELAKLPEEPQCQLAKTKILFRGKPVFGRKGVVADFGLEASGDFQRAIHRRSAALAKANTKGKIPPPGPLAIVGVAQGSFGFVFEEVVPEQGLLQGPSHTAQAILEIQNIIATAKNGDEHEFVNLMKSLDGGTAHAVRDLLDSVDSAGATFKVWSEEREVELSDREIAAASHWIQRVKLASDEVELLGTLAGIFTISKMFEFVPDGRKVIQGYLAPEVDPHDIARWIEHRCLAKFVVERKRRAGSRKPGPPKWTLISLEDLPEPSHESLFSDSPITST